ncbi:SUMF1/EgtB/PvdO family nonheme iron enzyme [Paracoccus yeei]|uniref:SUMF1/EgtB/PvdO family nonheme iron enzyme n=1 Tax=Paracoccus yeei TaxID=147645 RepID=UPI003BF888F3
MDPGLLRREPSGRCRQGLLHPAESARRPGRDKHDPPRVRIPRRVIKGGSHLCAPSHCRRYRPDARHAGAVDTSTSYLGFRCVWREGQGQGVSRRARWIPSGPSASAASAIGRATAGTMSALSGRTPSPALPSAPWCQLFRRIASTCLPWTPGRLW